MYDHHRDAEEEDSDEVQEVEPSEVGEFASIHANDQRIKHTDQNRLDRRNYDQKNSQIQPYKMYRQSPSKTNPKQNPEHDKAQTMKLNN